MAVLKKGECCSICWPVVPTVNEDFLENSDYVLLQHVLGHFFGLNVASQVQHDAYHQVSEPIQVNFIRIALGDFPLQGEVQLMHNHVEKPL